MLISRTLVLFHSVCDRLHLQISASHAILLPLAATGPFSASVSLFLFCR